MLKALLATAGALAAAALTPLIAGEANPAKIHVDSFTVMGISTVTTNEREASPDGLIPKMWARLRSEDILNRIPNRKDNSVIAVYCDYEHGRTGAYKYVLGAAVSPTKFVPRGMITQKIQAGTYARYTANGAPPPVVELWKRIWSDEKPGGLERAYKTDYEVYPRSLSQKSAQSQVDIYIGLK